jgi:hypothetical protein
MITKETMKEAGKELRKETMKEAGKELRKETMKEAGKELRKEMMKKMRKEVSYSDLGNTDRGTIAIRPEGQLIFPINTNDEKDHSEHPTESPIYNFSI